MSNFAKVLIVIGLVLGFSVVACLGLALIGSSLPDPTPTPIVAFAPTLHVPQTQIGPPVPPTYTPQPTYTPYPTNVPISVPASSVPGYTQTSCEGMDLPSQATSADCYSLDGGAVAALFYNSGGIYGIAVTLPETASTDEFSKAGTFMGMASVYAGLGGDDFIDAMEWMQHMEPSDFGVVNSFGNCVMQVSLLSPNVVLAFACLDGG